MHPSRLAAYCTIPTSEAVDLAVVEVLFAWVEGWRLNPVALYLAAEGSNPS
jgi:hypothetical protein